MKKLLIILFLLPFLGQAQTTYQLNYDSIRVNKTAGTGGTSLYGKVYLKNVSAGLSTDSALVVRNGRIFKFPAIPTLSFGTFGSTPNAQGGSYAAGVITLQPASASFPGGVTTGTQTFAGEKTIQSSGSGNTLSVNHASGNGAALNITKGGNGEGIYVNKTSGSGNAATIVGGNFAAEAATFSGIVTTTPDAVINGVNVGRGAGNIATNTRVGSDALSTNTTGLQNVAIGFQSLKVNTTGIRNTAIGQQTLFANTISSSNTAIGYAALSASDGGNENTSIGALSLQSITTGDTNTAIGSGTGSGITTGSGNTILGANVTGLSSSLTNNIILANGTGAVKAQHDATNWTLTGGVSATGSISSTPQGTLYGTAAGSITSAQLATSLTDETGSGLAVFATSPTLTTPTIGAATFTTLTGGTASTITYANTSAGSITDALSIRNGGTTAGTGNRINFITGTATQSARINSVLTSSTDANLVFSTMTGGTLGEAGRFLGDKSLSLTGAVFGTYASMNGGFQATNNSSGIFTGSGAEVIYSGGNGIFQSVNRTSGVYLPSIFGGSTVTIQSEGIAGITLSGSQAVRFNAYGAGTLTTDASGNITAVSDSTWKEQFKPFTRGLADLKALKPFKYHWTKESGLDTLNEYAYFKAQDVQKAIPEAVFPTKEGQPLGVQDRPIIATMINAINELQVKIEALEARIKVLENK